MKCEFRHNCEIQGQKFGFQKHLQPGIHEVPAVFIFDWFFVSLVLDDSVKILEAHYSEFEEFTEEELAKIKPEFIEILSKFLENEDKELDDENSEDDSSNSDDSLSDSEGSPKVSLEESEVKVSKKKLKKKGKR
jgi:hypothetical protein